jgi:SAM-dependent methyltransferase
MALLELSPLDAAREKLATEWLARDPQTPADVAAFYREAEHIGEDLDAWHQLPSRKRWTAIVGAVAQQLQPKVAIDIGCGAGYELAALRIAGVANVLGVEPNRHLWDRLVQAGFSVFPDVADIPDLITSADLLVCLDVLEHVPDPDAFLADIASRAHVGCVLVEATATHDVGTPLHLAANRGWHPGHCLELHGWKLQKEHQRVRIWQRVAAKAEPKAGALVVSYRTCSIPTMTSLLKLQDAGWDIRTKVGDGLVSRARSIIASRWWLETAEDVFLMIDDDIVFEPDDAKRLVEQCRNGHDIICAAYPIRDGAHLATAHLTADDVHFHPDEPPLEIRYAATGFMAVHRRVLDVLMPAMPLCHANQPHSFKPLFLPMVIDEVEPVGHIYLSEDWAFCERARAAGFKVWLDRTILLGHLAQIEVDLNNMQAVLAAHRIRRGEQEEDDDG